MNEKDYIIVTNCSRIAVAYEQIANIPTLKDMKDADKFTDTKHQILRLMGDLRTMSHRQVEWDDED